MFPLCLKILGKGIFLNKIGELDEKWNIEYVMELSNVDLIKVKGLSDSVVTKDN